MFSVNLRMTKQGRVLRFTWLAFNTSPPTHLSHLPGSPFAAERLVRLHRLLLRLEAEVLDVDAEVVVEELEEGVGQRVLWFV